MKIPVMWLDDKLPLTQNVPVKSTGEVDVELYQQLQYLASRYRYQSEEEKSEAEEWKAEYHRLKEGVQFREEPLVMEHTFACGELAGVPVDRKFFSVHPESWAKLPDSSRAKFEAIPVPRFPQGQTIKIDLKCDSKTTI